MNTSQKDLIQQAALKVFSQKGYAKTTMTDIAQQASINPATIYRFFSGKQALFQSLKRPDLDFPDPQEQQRRKKISRAALQVFSCKGFHAATMDEIAEAAGLSKASLYLYFPSKENLFTTILENPAAFSLINEALANPTDDLESFLSKLAKTYLSLFEDKDFTALLKIILAEGIRDPQIAAGFKEKVIQRGAENAARHLQKYCQLAPKALENRIRMFFGMLLSWGIMNCLLSDTKQNHDLDKIAQEHSRQFLHGIRELIL